jgi:hypothetical protein
MGKDSKFITLCKEVEMLKIDFILFPLEEFTIISCNPKSLGADAKKILVQSVINIASFRNLDSDPSLAHFKDSLVQSPIERALDNSSILDSQDNQNLK